MISLSRRQVIVEGTLFRKINELIPLQRPSGEQPTNPDNSPHRSLSGTNPDKMNGDDLNLVTSLTNAQTKETIVCDPNHFKYIQLLLSDLNRDNLKTRGHPVTSQSLDRAFEERDVVKWYWLRRARIQIIDGKLYINNNRVGIFDEEGYRTGVILYLRRMVQLYGHHLPDTDFLYVQ